MAPKGDGNGQDTVEEIHPYPDPWLWLEKFGLIEMKCPNKSLNFIIS